MANRTHQVKVWREFWPQTVGGRQPFQIRRNDRDFQAGDQLELREWDKSLHQYTGARAEVTVQAIYHGIPGLEPGYAALVIDTPKVTS